MHISVNKKLDWDHFKHKYFELCTTMHKTKYFDPTTIHICTDKILYYAYGKATVMNLYDQRMHSYMNSTLNMHS